VLNGYVEQALRYAALARDLGSGSDGSEGVEATVAMRRGQWQDAKRLLLAQHRLPDELRPQIGPFVDAVADPARRPPIVAALRAVDSKVATQANLLMPYLQLGQNDLVFEILNESLDRDRAAWLHDWDIIHAWTVEAAPIRKDPRFARLVERIGLLDYWKQYGYPDHCHVGGGDRALVCSS
jgi:hypothetical protein